jgi:hypothetical protein
MQLHPTASALELSARLLTKYHLHRGNPMNDHNLGRSPSRYRVGQQAFHVGEITTLLRAHLLNTRQASDPATDPQSKKRAIGPRHHH